MVPSVLVLADWKTGAAEAGDSEGEDAATVELLVTI